MAQSVKTINVRFEGPDAYGQHSILASRLQQAGDFQVDNRPNVSVAGADSRIIIWHVQSPSCAMQVLLSGRLDEPEVASLDFPPADLTISSTAQSMVDFLRSRGVDATFDTLSEPIDF